MLTVRHGNLFAHATGSCIIAHGCNAQGVMGSGFAASIRSMFPRAYKGYIDAAITGLPLGSLVVCSAPRGEPVIANCITQEFYGRDPGRVYVDYDAVQRCMASVARFSCGAMNVPVHLPFIGGGLANGDHEKLLKLFAKEFESTNATLWLN